MTREGAIDIIKSECYVFNPLNFDRSTMVNTALDMAIKALKQEPCEDAISRQAIDILVDELARAISDERSCISRGRSTATIMQDILELPSVTPQQKTGHWKRISIDKYSTHANYWYRCDRCGEDNLGDTAWCPSCGCRMEGKNEEI